jgi:hypothetical protein
MDKRKLKELQAAIQHLKEAELILRLSGWTKTHAEVVEILKKTNTLVALSNSVSQDKNNEHN